MENINFIDIDKNTEVIIDNCLISSIIVKNAFWIFLSQKSKNQTLTIQNSIFLNNTLIKTEENSQFSLLACSFSLIIIESFFKYNFLQDATFLFLQNQAEVGNFANLSRNVIFELNIATNKEIPSIISLNGVNEISINNISFLSNSASGSLLFLQNIKNTTKISNCIIYDNYGNELIKLEIALKINIFLFHCLNNNNNNSINSGNCLTIGNYFQLNLSNSIFSKNYASSSLTGIYLEHTSNIKLLNIENINDISANLEKIEFSNNIVNISSEKIIHSGNCINLMSLGSIILKNSFFSQNIMIPSINGIESGNPCLTSTVLNNNLYIESVLFEKNQAFVECSCLSFHGNDLSIINSSFLENQAIQLNFDDGQASYNLANEGGSLNLGAKNVTLFNVLIFNASALKGAGIFLTNKNFRPFQFLYANGLQIINNKGIQSAAIEFDATLFSGEIYFIDCSFKKNKVEFYGAISSFYYKNINIYYYHNDISYNYGNIAGSAFSFCHFGGNTFINETIFVGNVLNKSTFIGGAAIFVYGVVMTTYIYIKDCTFVENNSSFKGGAIQVTYGRIFIKDSIFTDNYAVVGGGAISVNVFCPGSLDNLVISSKYKVNQGGGILCENFASIR